MIKKKVLKVLNKSGSESSKLKALHINCFTSNRISNKFIIVFTPILLGALYYFFQTEQDCLSKTHNISIWLFCPSGTVGKKFPLPNNHSHQSKGYIFRLL
jgi:hypothetical protein